MLSLSGDAAQAAGQGQYAVAFDDVMVNARLEPRRLSRAAWQFRVATARARYQAFAEVATDRAKGVKKRRAMIDDNALPAGILSDPTLRRNDLYIEKNEVFIFRGVVARRHCLAEFERLPAAQIKALGLRLAGVR